MFASFGPLVGPFARGLEGMVSGILPGFLHLMQAAKPAVEAVAGVLSQLGKSLGGTLGALSSGVKGSSQFLSGLSSIISSLLPVVATLANILATALGPIVQSVAASSSCPSWRARSTRFSMRSSRCCRPSPPPRARASITLGANILALATGPLAGLITELLGLAQNVLPLLTGPLDVLIGLLNDTTTAAEHMLSLLSNIPGLGLPGTGCGGGRMGGLLGGGMIGSTAAGALRLTAGVAGATAGCGFGTWASGLAAVRLRFRIRQHRPEQLADERGEQALSQQITAALGSGIVETIPVAKARAAQLMKDIKAELAAGAITQAQATTLVNSVATALASRESAVKAAARKLGESLTVTLADTIASSNSASTMKTAIGTLLNDVKTAYDAGILTLKQDKALTTWLDGEAKQLEQIASQRAKVVGEIASARQLAASTAGNISGIASVQGFATSGVNGGAVTVGAMIGGLRTDLLQIRTFGVNIKKLAKMGLDKNYLMQLIALGPVQGG